jgi:hypothetical protein
MVENNISNSVGDGNISFDEFLFTLRGAMSDRRRALGNTCQKGALIFSQLNGLFKSWIKTVQEN